MKNQNKCLVGFGLEPSVALALLALIFGLAAFVAMACFGPEDKAASTPAAACNCEPRPCEGCRCDGCGCRPCDCGPRDCIPCDCGPCNCNSCDCGPRNTTIDIHVTIGIDLQPPEPASVMRLLQLPTWLLLPRIQPPKNATPADEGDLVATEELPGPCDCESPPEHAAPASPPPIRSPPPPQKAATPPAAVQQCPAPTFRYRQPLLPRRRF